ncbi:unnamed protein product [Paramecium pentaurelia]|uniref:Choline kinase n=1 Tax=Paramecium pentaurelia TaxID=43138 RepID=A0A8S1Y4B7_9CILI|nr:unnamed protein product [Paramecium pentaurelia]
MNSRSTHLTEYAIKEIISEKFTSWKQISPSQINISRLTGLTNITYKAQAMMDTTPQTILFREFGNAEGFVDSQQERIVFKTISDMDLGPQQLECGDSWRMEEFVKDGVHPNNQKMAEANFQFKSMGVLQKFHQMDIPIPNNGSSLILRKTISEEMKENVIKKIEKRQLYTDVELKQLECMENFINNAEEFNYLNEMTQKENHEELKFCHNDLNQLNIFNTSKKDKEIIFIDYEYCSYNYPSYDIANFLNESAINYQHEEEPYYILVDDNFNSAPIQAHFLALSYIINKECTQMEIDQIQKLINEKTNKNKDELKNFIGLVKQILEQRLSEQEIVNLFNAISYLKRRIRRFQIISNLNWVWWSILLAHEKNSLNFEYIDYGLLRFKMLEKLLELEKARKKKEEIPYFKFCQKLGGVKMKDIYISPTKAATFLHLINNKCPKQTALQFAQRRICKWDTTIKMDGPSTCRILKPKDSKDKRINGWQNIGLEMYYDNKATIADKNQLELDFDNDAIQKQIEKNEMKLKNDFKNKIAHLQQFYRDLNKKYCFNSNDPDFKNKIRKAKFDLLNNRNLPIKYFKTKGMKYIEIYNELNKKNTNDISEGLLKRLRVFNQLRTDQYRVKEKSMADIYRQKKENQSPIHKELQHDVNIYDNMEEQSEQMLKIIDQSNEFSMKLKKNEQKPVVSQKAIVFAEDFNRAKYLFNLTKQNQMQKMFEIPEVPQLVIPQSSQSIRLMKNLSSPTSLDEQFDNCLNQYAREVIEYQQEIIEKEISTDNIEKLLQEKEILRCSQMRKVSRTYHSPQPSVHLDSSRQMRYQQQLSSRDRESTKAGNSFHLKSRTYAVSPFCK